MPFSDLKGKTLIRIEINEDRERIIFFVDDGTAYESVHLQDCCEDVAIERVEGCLEHVTGLLILEAEETVGEVNFASEWESCTHTLQRIRTERGEVMFDWLGCSNGYYTESEVPYFQITHGDRV